MSENSIYLVRRQGPRELRRHCNHSLSAQADRESTTGQRLPQRDSRHSHLTRERAETGAIPESEMGAAVILSNIREKVYLRAMNVIRVANPSDTSNELPSTVRTVN